MKTLFIVNTVVLVYVSFSPSDTQISLYQKIYNTYKEPTTLYFIKDNPYHRILNIHFYKRKNLLVKEIDSIKNIPDGGNNLIVLKNLNTKTDPRLNKLVYQTFPDWMFKLNFNHWIERSNAWYVYEVK